MAKDFKYKTLGKTGFSVTEAGFGCYKIDVRSPINLDALKKALVAGINLIDTGAEFANGNSEVLVGDVVRDLVDSNRLSRDSLVIVTKAEELSEEQITESLERLQLESIDVFLLHNPKDDHKAVKKAFEYLELEVKMGRIKYYGISSDTIPLAASLEKLLDTAREVSEDNHFSVIQFPMNFAEAGKEVFKILQLAQENDLGVLITRPLNAVYEGKVIKLAEPPVFNPPGKKQVNDDIKTILELEKSAAKKLKDCKDKDFASQIEKCLYVAEKLHAGWTEAGDIAGWDAVLKQYYLPKLRTCNNLMKKSSFKDEELEMDLYGVTYKLGRLYGSITAYYNSKHRVFVDKIRENIVKAAPELGEIDKLSKMAVRALRSTAGVSCVLVGMTQSPYVNDVLNELKEPALNGFDWSKINFSDLIDGTKA